MWTQDVSLTHELQLLVISELVIIGVWVSTGKDMVFEELALNCDLILPQWVRNPLYDCTVCMASAWGSAMWWLCNPVTGSNVLFWPFFVLALAGLGKLVLPFITEKE